MSKTKAVSVRGRGAWVLDSSHDIVLARMVEAAQSLGGIDDATLTNWKVRASVPDLAFEHDRPLDPGLAAILVEARTLVDRHGDVYPGDVRGWHLLDDIAVTNGFIRYDPLPVHALHDVLDGFADLLAGTLDPDPPGSWWFLGVPGGRRTIEMRPSNGS